MPNGCGRIKSIICDDRYNKNNPHGERAWGRHTHWGPRLLPGPEFVGLLCNHENYFIYRVLLCISRVHYIYMHYSGTLKWLTFCSTVMVKTCRNSSENRTSLVECREMKRLGLPNNLLPYLCHNSIAMKRQELIVPMLAGNSCQLSRQNRKQDLQESNVKSNKS